jgi:hypothetical protein
MMGPMHRLAPLALALAAMLALAGAARAEQLPVMGCRAATNCGYKGFSTRLSSAGEGYSSNLFGVSLSVDGGTLQARLARVPSQTVDWRAVDAAIEVFIRSKALKTPPREAEERPAPELESNDPDSTPR